MQRLGWAPPVRAGSGYRSVSIERSMGQRERSPLPGEAL